MTQDKARKRAVRARMERTGESYAAASAHTGPDRPTDGLTPRFTPRLARIVERATVHAPDGDWLGCELLVHCMLDDEGAIPTHVLSQLGVLEQVRTALTAFLASDGYTTRSDDEVDIPTREALIRLGIRSR